MTSVSCRCDRIAVSYPSAPIGCVQCCCVDCYQRNALLNTKSNTPMPKDLEQFGKKPIDNIYLPGKFKFDRGSQEDVIFVKVREDSNSINCCCKDCWTVVALDHPSYAGKMTCISTEFSPFHVSGQYNTTPLLRGNILDFEPEAYAALEPMDSLLYVEKGEMVNMNGAFEKLRAAVEQSEKIGKEAGSEYKTFQEICSGQEIVVLGVPEMAQSARLRSR